MMPESEAVLRKVNRDMSRKYIDYADDLKPSAVALMSIVLFGSVVWLVSSVRRCLGIQ